MIRSIQIITILLLTLPAVCFAQKPSVVLEVGNSTYEIDSSIDTIGAKLKITAKWDTLSFSVTTPQSYLLNVDTLKVRIFSDSLFGKPRVSYRYTVGSFPLSLSINGVCIDCSAPEIVDEIIFCAHSSFSESTMSLDWHDNYALTGGGWLRCGLLTDLTTPYQKAIPFSQIVYDVFQVDGCNEDTLAKGDFCGSIHQFYDPKGLCKLELRDHEKITYSYYRSGKLKKEVWKDDSSNTIAKIHYRYRGNQTQIVYKLFPSNEKYMIVTTITDVSQTVCKNSNNTIIWSRTTTVQPNSTHTMINDNPELIFSKEYDTNGSVVQEGFLGDSSCTLFEYQYSKQDLNWVKAIRFVRCKDELIPNLLIERRIVR